MNELEKQNWVNDKQDEIIEEIERSDGTIDFIDVQKINLATTILNQLKVYERSLKGLNKSVRNDITLLINKLKQNG